jgi:hypothetical protein
MASAFAPESPSLREHVKQLHNFVRHHAKDVARNVRGVPRDIKQLLKPDESDAFWTRRRAAERLAATAAGGGAGVVGGVGAARRLKASKQLQLLAAMMGALGAGVGARELWLQQQLRAIQIEAPT